MLAIVTAALSTAGTILPEAEADFSHPLLTSSLAPPFVYALLRPFVVVPAVVFVPLAVALLLLPPSFFLSLVACALPLPCADARPRPS